MFLKWKSITDTKNIYFLLICFIPFICYITDLEHICHLCSSIWWCQKYDTIKSCLSMFWMHHKRSSVPFMIHEMEMCHLEIVASDIISRVASMYTWHISLLLLLLFLYSISIEMTFVKVELKNDALRNINLIKLLK